MAQKEKKDLRAKPSPAHDRPDDELERSRELLDEKGVEDTLMEVYKDITKGFDDQSPRSNEIMDNWDIYNCKLGPNQYYDGVNKIFVPLVHDAMNARSVRFTNQLFPQSGRCVEIVSEDGTTPHALMALQDHYIKKARLRTQLAPALVRQGDCEGQYTVYVSWVKNERSVVHRANAPAQINTPEGVDLEDPDNDAEAIIEEEIVHQYPTVEIISDPDFLVLPQTSASIEEAISNGGCVTIIRRWGKAKIKQLIEDGEIDKERGEGLLKSMGDAQAAGSGAQQRVDMAKRQVDAAGIRSDGRGKYAQVYEVWMKLFVDGRRRICRAYLSGGEKSTDILSCKRNPFWSDKLPIISCPVRKVHGAFKGRPLVSAVADFQILANDATNEGMDSAAYALMPIVMTDPEKNPRVGSMILSLAAIWETNPNDTQFAQFPALWKDALEIVATARNQIFQTLSVNPAAISQLSSKKKMNQAETAQEQQIDILTTADACTMLEEGIFTPMLERFVEMDHQFRDDDVTVRQYGQMGARAKMEKIPPIQFNRKWQFVWNGVQAARNAQQVQQQIAAINVIRGIPPELYQGYQLDMVPVIEQIVENAFGPRLAPLVFKDMRSSLGSNPEEENELLSMGTDMPVHPMDDHQQHMQVHAKLMQEQGGDPSGAIRIHLLKHQQMMAQQQAAMAEKMQPKGQPGAPGGAGPGQPGQPRPGAQPMAPRGGQNPPGAIHHDRLQGAGIMPRRAG